MGTGELSRNCLTGHLFSFEIIIIVSIINDDRKKRFFTGALKPSNIEGSYPPHTLFSRPNTSARKDCASNLISHAFEV
jgi:hypothetical protein